MESTDEREIMLQVGAAGRVGEGVHAHTEFLITSNVFSPEKVSNHRRFSDFVWLHEQLTRECAGFIIPPLPEKAVNALQGPAFLRYRQMGLQLFLNGIKNHNALRSSKCLKSFLLCNAVEFTAAKAAATQEKNKASGPLATRKETLSTWWGKTYQRFTENESIKTLAAKAGKDLSKGEKTVQDAEFDVHLEYVLNLLSQLKNLENRVQSVYRHGYAMATAFFEMSASVSVLAEMEEEEPYMDKANLSAIEPILKERAKQVETEVEGFGDEIAYFVRCVTAALNALKVREDRRFTFQAAQSHLEKLMSQDTSTSKDGLPEARQRVHETKLAFDEVHTRVMTEMDRFKREKASKLRNIFARFLELQMKYNTQMVKRLATAIPLNPLDDDEIQNDRAVKGNLKNKIVPPAAPVDEIRRCSFDSPSLMEPEVSYDDIAL